MPTEVIECPLCLGEGHLKRTEVLDRLGVKDFARVAQLSAEEAFRLLLSKQQNDEQNVWARFEPELAKRTTLISDRHKDELHAVRTAEQQQPVPVDERLPNLFLFTMSMVRTNRAVSFELTNHFRVVDSALSGREPFRSSKSRCAGVPLTRCVHRPILPTTGSGPLVLSPA
jgi:hypothetical protein